MKPLLIAKLGSTFPALAQTYGDFEDWIAARLKLPADRMAVLDARRESLPDPDRFAGIVLTGSHAMITDREPWSLRAAEWTAEAVAAGVPLLGICYGHQLLAHALGGEVGFNPAGREFGTTEIRFVDSAGHDPLFADIGRRILAHTSHAQSVLRLPPGAVVLAGSAKDPCHAFTTGGAAWGVQFHPEFDARVAGTYIRHCADDLRRQGDDPETMLEDVRETPESATILARFAQIACGERP